MAGPAVEMNDAFLSDTASPPAGAAWGLPAVGEAAAPPRIRVRRRWPPLEPGLGLRLLPGLFFVVYLTLTVLLFAFGPWPWPVQDGTLLYGFLAAAHLALLIGYLSAASGEPRGYSALLTPRRLLPISLLANLLLLGPTVAARTGSFLPDVAAGIANPGAAYNLSVTWREGGPLLIVEYVRILLAPLLAVGVPLTIYYWRALRPWSRLLGLLTILGAVATYVAMGTNKAIADLILVLPWLVLASHVAGFRRLRRRHVVAAGAGLLIAFLLFFAFFTAGQLTRRGSGAQHGYFSAAQIFADQRHPLVGWLPDEPRAGALALIMYVTHGYYAVYLSLQEPFIPMFGVGNSFFLQRNAARVLDAPQIQTLPYPMRIEYQGWDAMGLWSTIYPWLASDLSFPGVLLLVFLIGRLYAQSWLDALGGSNPFAVVTFGMLTLMLSYFPANNQIGQDGEALVAFLVILTCWRLTRSRRSQVAR
jgi:hypothetical protein